MSDTNCALVFAMEFELPSFSPSSLSPTGMKEDISGLFTYREYALALKSRVKQLEQQLSNSISKDKVRGLVDNYEVQEDRASNQFQAYDAIDNLIKELNKLLTNKEEG